MPQRTQYRDRMFAMIETWQHSGQSKKTFCAEQCITYHRFHYWHRRYKTHHSTADTNVTAFIPLHLPATTASAELIYPDGRRLLFHQEVDASFLKTLLG